MSKSSLTKNAIAKHFFELLSEKPLNQISVKELAAAVGINRNTFYYHYKSIPDLLEAVVKHLVDELFENYPPAESLDDCLTAATDFIKQNESGIRHIYDSTSRPVFERYLWRICDYVVISYLNTGPNPADSHLGFIRFRLDTPENRLATQQLLSCICFGLAMNYIRHGMSFDADPVRQLLDISDETPKN